MAWFSSKQEDNTPSLPWQKLNDSSLLTDIIKNKSGEKHILFKHSTRCGISSMAISRFQKEWNEDFNDVHIWYLDLLNFREISNDIAEKTGVYHQSPQAIAIQNGEVKYSASHSDIDIAKAVKSFEA